LNCRQEFIEEHLSPLSDTSKQPFKWVTPLRRWPTQGRGTPRSGWQVCECQTIQSSMAVQPLESRKHVNLHTLRSEQLSFVAKHQHTDNSLLQIC